MYNTEAHHMPSFDTPKGISKTLEIVVGRNNTDLLETSSVVDLALLQC